MHAPGGSPARRKRGRPRLAAAAPATPSHAPETEAGSQETAEAGLAEKIRALVRLAQEVLHADGFSREQVLEAQVLDTLL